MRMIRDYTLILLALAMVFTVNAQTYKNVQYGNFENWVVRDIEESLIIGGDVKRIEVRPAKGFLDVPQVRVQGLPSGSFLRKADADMIFQNLQVPQAL